MSEEELRELNPGDIVIITKELPQSDYNYKVGERLIFHGSEIPIFTSGIRNDEKFRRFDFIRERKGTPMGVVISHFSLDIYKHIEPISIIREQKINKILK